MSGFEKPSNNQEKVSSSAFSLLISVNGSLAGPGHSIGGGDVVIFKFIRLSKTNPDLLIPSSAEQYAVTTGQRFRTMASVRPTLWGILFLYFVRICQGVWRAIRNSKRHDIALAASPFSVDIIPLWFWKAKRKGAIVYHLLPERKAVNWVTRLRFGIAAVEQRITLKLLGHVCDFIVAGNEFTRQELQARMPDKKYFILPAGIDLAVIDQVPAEAKDPHLACFVGRLVSQKGIFDLLKIMQEIHRADPRLRLVIAGTGPEGDLLKAEIARLQLTNIELTGFISEEEKIRLLKRATYFFFPSYEEGWGIALAEALYCECRCICYELPHYRSIFGEYPSYVPLGDPVAFVRAYVASDEIFPEQRKFMRQYDDPLVVRGLAEYLSTIHAG